MSRMFVKRPSAFHRLRNMAEHQGGLDVGAVRCNFRQPTGGEGGLLR